MSRAPYHSVMKLSRTLVPVAFALALLAVAGTRLSAQPRPFARTRLLIRSKEMTHYWARPYWARPRNLTIKQYGEEYGPGRTKTYELIASGELQAIKDGSSTYIPLVIVPTKYVLGPRYDS